MKYLICFSGGHSSALAAIETVKKYGKENCILLNHDISPNVEHQDIKRFKIDVANYLDIPITYANMPGWETNDHLDVCMSIKAFKVGMQSESFCTSRLKGEPFKKYLRTNFPSKSFEPRKDVVIIYGFDANERHRIQRRIGVAAGWGYLTDYPLAGLEGWEKTIFNTEEIGIKRPVTYEIFRHANCIGCLKSGKQQWYVTFCLRPDIWEKAKAAEELIGYSILKDGPLIEIEPEFKKMQARGIVPSEKLKFQSFWAAVRRSLKDEQLSLPCECAI